MTISHLSRCREAGDTYPRMESEYTLPSGGAAPAPDAVPVADEENDPELERDLRALAQWLFDVYLWRLDEERKAPNPSPVDKGPAPPTM